MVGPLEGGHYSQIVSDVASGFLPDVASGFLPDVASGFSRTVNAAQPADAEWPINGGIDNLR